MKNASKFKKLVLSVLLMATTGYAIVVVPVTQYVADKKSRKASYTVSNNTKEEVGVKMSAEEFLGSYRNTEIRIKTEDIKIFPFHFLLPPMSKKIVRVEYIGDEIGAKQRVFRLIGTQPALEKKVKPKAIGKKAVAQTNYKYEHEGWIFVSKKAVVPDLRLEDVRLNSKVKKMKIALPKFVRGQIEPNYFVDQTIKKYYVYIGKGKEKKKIYLDKRNIKRDTKFKKYIILPDSKKYLVKTKRGNFKSIKEQPIDKSVQTKRIIVKTEKITKKKQITFTLIMKNGKKINLDHKDLENHGVKYDYVTSRVDKETNYYFAIGKNSNIKDLAINIKKGFNHKYEIKDLKEKVAVFTIKNKGDGAMFLKIGEMKPTKASKERDEKYNEMLHEMSIKNPEMKSADFTRLRVLDDIKKKKTISGIRIFFKDGTSYLAPKTSFAYFGITSFKRVLQDKEIKYAIIIPLDKQISKIELAE